MSIEYFIDIGTVTHSQSQSFQHLV
jgi:hypothetical protein